MPDEDEYSSGDEPGLLSCNWEVYNVGLGICGQSGGEIFLMAASQSFP